MAALAINNRIYGRTNKLLFIGTANLSKRVRSADSDTVYTIHLSFSTQSAASNAFQGTGSSRALVLFLRIFSTKLTILNSELLKKIKTNSNMNSINFSRNRAKVTNMEVGIS